MLTLSRPAYDEVVERALGSDDEVCGVLTGDHGPSEDRVRSVYHVENVADDPRTRYRIDPAEALAVVDEAEAAGEELVGFYHSHPRGPPRPSETDAERAAWPGYSYVICALDGAPYLGSWRWTGERFEREAVALD